MPAPLAHIYYGQKYLDNHTDHVGSAFYQGTVFPDIRRLGTVSREKTHRAGLKFEEVLTAESDWQAGWVFHNWLDEYWNKYFYPKLIPGRAEDEISWLALKLLEGQLLQRDIRDRKSVAEMFGKEVPEEQANADAETLRVWHSIIKEMILLPPTDETQGIKWQRAFKFTAVQITEINQRAEEMRNTPEWLELLDGVKSSVEQEIRRGLG